VRDGEHAAAPCNSAEQRQERDAGAPVQPRQRLVQQQQRRAAQQLHGQGQAALLSARQAAQGRVQGQLRQTAGAQNALGISRTRGAERRRERVRGVKDA